MSSIMATNFQFSPVFVVEKGAKKGKKFLAVILAVIIFLCSLLPPLFQPHLRTTPRQQFVFNFERCNYFEIKVSWQSEHKFPRVEEMFTICFIHRSFLKSLVTFR